MESTPLVSIITPVYNGAAYLDDLIVSVHDQDYQFIEHIIIDDGSNDNGATVAILKKYPHLRWWSRENRGQYATMNEGLNAATGEFVCFVSADDILADGAVRRVMDFIQRHPVCDGVYGLAAYMREDGKPYLSVVPFRRLSLRYYPYFSHVQHCSLFVSKDILVEKNIFFNDKLHYVGDYDWLIRLLEDHLHIELVQVSLSWIRVHEEQTSVQSRNEMRTELFQVAMEHGVNPFFLGITFILTIWTVNLYKLYFTLKQQGLVGAKSLIFNWFRRRIPIQNK